MERNSLLILKDLVASWERDCDHYGALLKSTWDRDEKLEISLQRTITRACIRDLQHRIGKIEEEERSGYEAMVYDIARCPMTFLPALLSAVVLRCLESGVFRHGDEGLQEFVRNIERSALEAMRVKDDD